MKLNLFEPVLNILKCLSFVDGIGQDYAHGPSVVGLGDSFELLLSRCVPNLQPYFVTPDGDGFYFEVDADGGEVRSHEGVVAELEEHVGFSYTAVADDQ